MSTDKETAGYVYIIDYGNGKSFKIGHTSKDPEKRLSQISSGTVLMPMKLVFAVEFDNRVLLEKILHSRLYDKKIQGEWFDLDFIELVELYQILFYFGEVKIYDHWYEIVPKDIDIFIKNQIIHGNLPRFTPRITDG